MTNETIKDDLAKPWWKSKKVFVFLVLVATFEGTLALQVPLSPAYKIPEEAINYLALALFLGGTTLIGALGVKEALAVTRKSQ